MKSSKFIENKIASKANSKTIYNSKKLDVKV